MLLKELFSRSKEVKVRVEHPRTLGNKVCPNSFRGSPKFRLEVSIVAKTQKEAASLLNSDPARRAGLIKSCASCGRDYKALPVAA